MTLLRGGTLVWIEAVGRVLELALAALLWPLGRAARWLWNHVLAELFGAIADVLLPKRGKRPADTAPPPVKPAAPAPPGPPAAAPVAPPSGPGAPAPPGGPPTVVGKPWWQPAFGRLSWRTSVAFVLFVATAALVTVMRRVDSALQQMHLDGQSAGSALGFPVSFGDLHGSLGYGSASAAIADIRTGWTGYREGVANVTTLDDPYRIARSLVSLDAAFIVLYSLVAIVLMVVLYRRNARTAVPARQQEADRLATMVVSSGVALVLLVAADITEDWQLHQSLIGGGTPFELPPGIALGPLMSLLKLVFGAATVVPAGIVAVTLAVRTGSLWIAVRSARGILYGLLALVVLLNVGIGANQLDDVVRAWDGWRAAWAALACVVLSGTVAGATRRLTGIGMERPAPDAGRSAQPFLLASGALLFVIGLLLDLAGWGWGLEVAGGLLVGLWSLGLAFDRLPDWSECVNKAEAQNQLTGTRTALAALAGAGVGAVLALARAWSLLQVAGAALLGAYAVLIVLAAWLLVRSRHADEAPAARPGPLPERHDLVEIWGARLGRFAGAVVVAMVVVTVARATALDAYVKKEPDWEVLRAPVLAAVAVAAWGTFLSGYRPRRTAPALWTSLWFLFTVAAFAGGFYLFQDEHAVTGAIRTGSMALLLGGFTLVLGLIGLVGSASRRGSFSRYQLSPALRVMNVSRFPMLTFVVAWALIVSVLDPGGFHDIRRLDGRTAQTAPTLYDAWQAFAKSAPATGTARPVVIVSAQGGGIRAAVWTALVMECLFGPGPVAKYGDRCAQGTGTPQTAALAREAKQPLPVFLASGASGGSVGLAAWSARRADLFVDEAGAVTPETVEKALSSDFVAPDVARLLLADVPHTLLAWDETDRAEMLERSWEQAWRPDGSTAPDRGLSRGLRELWSTTHDTKDTTQDWATPVLALNGISVEDDCRFVSSAIDFALPTGAAKPTGSAGATGATGSSPGSTMDGPDDHACRGPVRPDDTRSYTDILPSTSELVDYLCPTEDVPLSTAAHLSARFPYVSPTGRVERRGCDDAKGLVPPPAVSYDADGGLFDNSGAGTAVDAWRALQPLVAQTEPATGPGCYVPIFVQIDNSPPAATVASSADGRPVEPLAPVTATLSQISSREAYARAGAAAAFTRAVSAGGRPVYDSTGKSPQSLWFRITLFGQPGPEPPLGWTLARETVDDMRSQLAASANADAMTAIQQLLKSGALTCH